MWCARLTRATDEELYEDKDSWVSQRSTALSAVPLQGLPTTKHTFFPLNGSPAALGRAPRSLRVPTLTGPSTPF